MKKILENRLILVGLILILGGLFGYLIFGDYLCLECLVAKEDGLSTAVKKKSSAQNHSGRTKDGFTSLVRKNSENIKENIIETEPTKAEIPEDKKKFVPQIGFFAPPFVLKDLNDQTITLVDFKEKNFLMVFWATTCGWCAAEKNDLMRFTEDQKGKIEVVAILDEPKEVVLEYSKKEKVNFIILLDNNRATFNKYEVLGTPAHFMINKSGLITDWRPGYTAYDGFLWMLNTLKND